MAPANMIQGDLCVYDVRSISNTLTLNPSLVLCIRKKMPTVAHTYKITLTMLYFFRLTYNDTDL